MTLNTLASYTIISVGKLVLQIQLFIIAKLKFCNSLYQYSQTYEYTHNIGTQFTVCTGVR